MNLRVVSPGKQEYIAGVSQVIPLLPPHGIIIVYSNGKREALNNVVGYQGFLLNRMVMRLGKFYHDWMDD